MVLRLLLDVVRLKFPSNQLTRFSFWEQFASVVWLANQFKLPLFPKVSAINRKFNQKTPRPMGYSSFQLAKRSLVKRPNRKPKRSGLLAPALRESFTGVAKREAKGLRWSLLGFNGGLHMLGPKIEQEMYGKSGKNHWNKGKSMSCCSMNW